jgi:long-chain acyl-CoA synthetase
VSGATGRPERPPLHYPDIPFHAILQRSADAEPERVVLHDGPRQYTLRELDGITNATTGALIGLGVQPGDRVALAAPNRADWVTSQLAIAQAGAAAVLPNPSWRSELAHAFEITRPQAVIADAGTAAALDRQPGPALRICLDDDRPAGWLSLPELIAAQPGTRPRPVLDAWADVDVALPFSSGTTGLPKAVRHTHRSLLAAVTQWKSASTIGREDRLQLFLPLFHIYGLITIACGYWAAAPTTLFPRFDVDGVLGAIERERTTIGFGVAPVAVAFASHPRLEQYDLSSIRYFLWGASPMIPDVARTVTRRSGIRWAAAYGTTEGPVLHVNPVRDPDRCRLDSPGLPVSDLTVRVVDVEARTPVSPGEAGEILVRSPSTMAGYLPEAETAGAFEDGWFRTGDIGTSDEAGWLTLTDRLKEMMKVNGFPVSPAEVESVLFAHQAVADCAVYGVPDARTGEAPVAAVRLADGAAADEAELVAWVAGRLARYKHLAAVVFVTEIPRTQSGKVLRRELRRRHPGPPPAC